MNNSDNYQDIDKINSQLERADIHKNRLFQNIYREYEVYLNLVRDLLYISVEKGLNELYCYLSPQDSFYNANEYFCLFEKKISKIIHTKLPFLTVEQLKINEFEKDISKDFNSNSLGSLSKTKVDQIIQHEDGFQFEETIQFQINEDISNVSEYYSTDNREKLISLDLDNNYLSDKNVIENIGLEKQFISSLLELIEEVNYEKPRYSEKDNNNKMDVSPKHQSLRIFDLIDKSLENLLLNLSYKINQELFNANLIKKIISKNSFEYLVLKKLMIKHPHPFVINFELNINQSSSKSDISPSINFLNISTVELEYKNLNLSIQRNKINELKNQFKRLIKKETYWRQKEITLNKIR